VCLALPCNATSVLRIDPTKPPTSPTACDTLGSLTGGWLYHGGALGRDGKVYAIPANATHVLQIDPISGDVTEVGPDFGSMKQKWYGGILCEVSGAIYGIPHNAAGVLKIVPPSTKEGTTELEVSVFGDLGQGKWKWHGGTITPDQTTIYGYPNNASTILKINVTDDTITLLSGTDTNPIRSGRHRTDDKYKYLGGAIHPAGNGKLFLFPCDAERVLTVDLKTDAVELVGPELLGPNKFQNGFYSAVDGAVYAIPQCASGVLRIGVDVDVDVNVDIDVDNHDGSGKEPSVERLHNGKASTDKCVSDAQKLTVSCSVDVLYCGDEMSSCKDKFEGGVLGSDGCIYCIPLRAKRLIRIVPAGLTLES